ncbi:MAG: hypothetical protein AB1938_03510 [Myxococcota bacterium]
MTRALVLSVLLTAPVAHAVDFGVGVGVLEVVLLPPAHGGFYVYAGGSVAVPIGKGFSFVGSVSIEWSFDQMRGGFVVVSTLDYLLVEHWGLDLNVVFIEDQPGLKFSEAQLFLGGGPGATFFLGKWAFSLFFNLLGGLNVQGLSLVPGLNVGYTF